MQFPSRPLIRRYARIATMAAALAVACASGASAQVSGIGGGVPGGGGGALGGGGGRGGGGGAPEKAAPAPPSPVPGAVARQPVIPASKTANDLDPNEALFDSINRGDIAAARDALNRGADLGATNVLGMTPMELSVDLGRNDITFLLLSERGGESDSGSSARNQASQLVPSVATKGVAKGRSAQVADQVPSGRTPAGKIRQGSPPTVAANKPAAAPKLFAGDGGTPQPQAGFLGFGR
jgi:hypothetical protein